MKKLILVALLFVGSIVVANDNKIEIDFEEAIENDNILKLATEICLEEIDRYNWEGYDTSLFGGDAFIYRCTTVAKKLSSMNDKTTALKILDKSCVKHINDVDSCVDAVNLNEESGLFSQAEKHFQTLMTFLPQKCNNEYREYQDRLEKHWKSIGKRPPKGSKEYEMERRVMLAVNFPFRRLQGYYCGLLGHIYRNGMYHIKADKQEALNYYEQWCEMNDECQEYNELRNKK